MVPHPFRWGLEAANNRRRKGQVTERSRNILSQEIQREVPHLSLRSMMASGYQLPALPEIKLIPEFPSSLSQ